MSNSEIRAEDSGTTLKRKIKRPDETDYPLDGYSVLQYKFQKPDGSIMIKDATLDQDGYVVFTTQDGDFDQIGLWKYQVYFERGSVKHHTDYASFRVHPNLPLS
jgi:hypothetical protein